MKRCSASAGKKAARPGGGALLGLRVAGFGHWNRDA